MIQCLLDTSLQVLRTIFVVMKDDLLNDSRREVWMTYDVPVAARIEKRPDRVSAKVAEVQVVVEHSSPVDVAVVLHLNDALARPQS